jgi:hypothetical protein
VTAERTRCGSGFGPGLFFAFAMAAASITGLGVPGPTASPVTAILSQWPHKGNQVQHRISEGLP